MYSSLIWFSLFTSAWTLQLLESDEPHCSPPTTYSILYNLSSTPSTICRDLYHGVTSSVLIKRETDHDEPFHANLYENSDCTGSIVKTIDGEGCFDVDVDGKVGRAVQVVRHRERDVGVYYECPCRMSGVSNESAANLSLAQKVLRQGTDHLSRYVLGAKTIVSSVVNSKPQKCNSDKTMEELGTDWAERFRGSVDGATFKGLVDGKVYSMDIRLIPKEEGNKRRVEQAAIDDEGAVALLKCIMTKLAL